MWREMNSLQDLRRKNYLFILPGVLIATLAILFIQINKTEYTIKLYAHIAFIIAFIIGWLLAYRNRYLKTFEYFMLVLVYVYYLLMIMLDIVRSISVNEVQDLSVFIIWMPLIIIYTFSVLRKMPAFIASLFLFFITLIPGIYYFFVNSELIESLTRTYLSTAVYSIVLLFAYQLIRTEVEVQVMRKQLHLDHLTKIGNRYQIDLWMNELIRQSKLEAYSILFLDIDLFKMINDKYGHKVGDDVLKELAQLLKTQIDRSSYIGRWGGEEFIILVKASECVAYQYAESLRLVVEAHDFQRIGCSLTISVGITGVYEEDTLDTILVRADERLYRSKNDGRNRVTGAFEDEGNSVLGLASEVSLTLEMNEKEE